MPDSSYISTATPPDSSCSRKRPKLEYKLFDAWWSRGKNGIAPIIAPNDDIRAIVGHGLRQIDDTVHNAEVEGSPGSW